MTDRVFQGGTADWFDLASWSPEGVPSLGDTLTIGSGIGTISAGDATAFGTLGAEQLLIGSDSATARAGFAADSASFSSGFAIADAGAGFASLTFSGAVDYDGSMDFGTSHGLVSIGIASDLTGNSDLTLGGTVAVTNGDSLNIDGGTLELDGTVDVAGGTLTIGPDTTLAGDGTIDVSGDGTVVIDGAVSSGVTINFDDATSTLDLVNPLQFHGFVSGFVTGDVIDLINAPSETWGYDKKTETLTIYSGNASSGNPQVASFGLASTTTLSSSAIFVGDDGEGGSLVLLSHHRSWIGGDGDWYDTDNWTTAGTLAPNSYPLPGDTASIASGTVTITAADFAAFGSLDNAAISLSGVGAALSLTDGVIGPRAVITDSATQGDTTLVADGTVTVDGTIQAKGADSGLDVTVGNAGTVAGDLLVESYATLATGTESALNFAGGDVTNDGNIILHGGATVAAGATIDGNGVINFYETDVTLTVAGSIGPSQQVAFYSDQLNIAPGAQFNGIIEDFGSNDTIDLEGVVANYASFDASTSELTLYDGGATGPVVARLNVAGNYGPSDFATTTDGDGGTFITDTVSTAETVIDASLPAPAVVAAGESISLAQLLVDSFGTSALSIPDVQVSSYSAADMGYFSYWDPNNPTLPYWTLNGTAIAPDNLETIPETEYADVDYIGGNAIVAGSTIQIPVSFSAGAADGYVDYGIQNFVSACAQPSLDSGAPTALDVVNAAAAFSAAYSNVPNTEDCWNIAMEVAAAAGATMEFNTDSTDPEENVAGGFWRFAYAAPQNDTAVSNWSSLVQAGDIMRIGWADDGGPHSFTVVAPLDNAGSITVFDNVNDTPGYEAIGTHQVTYWNSTNSEDITIYQLDPNDLYLVDYTTSEGALIQDLPDAIMQGTTFNNLIIPSGTGDTITGGTGDNVIADTSAIMNGATITDFHAGDTIDVTDLNSAVTSATYDATTGILDVISSGGTVAQLQLPDALAGTFVVSNDGGTAGLDGGTLGTLYADLFTGATPNGSEITLVTCFAAGTRITTPSGSLPVETLRPGDRVVCAEGGTQPIVWVGHRALDLTRHPEPERVLPVRIAPGAFAAGVPSQPLLLSPDHAIFAMGVLIPIRHLINGSTVAQVRSSERRHIVYYHIELPEHDAVFAEGLTVESYLDTGNRDRFRNGGPSVMLFPDFAPLIWEAKGYAPLRILGPEVDALRVALAERAMAAQSAAPPPVYRRPSRRGSVAW